MAGITKEMLRLLIVINADFRMNIISKANLNKNHNNTGRPIEHQFYNSIGNAFLSGFVEMYFTLTHLVTRYTLYTYIKLVARDCFTYFKRMMTFDKYCHEKSPKRLSLESSYYCFIVVAML